MVLNSIHQGDCIEVMRTFPANFADTIITDPPYGLDFMGKDWDGDVPGVHFWEEMLRVCKPGALLLSFGGTRTWHHLAIAIEKAGWEIRDCLMWVYGSGFPKSLDISKAIDKAKGAERVSGALKFKGEWNGWGTALKPAWEPIIVAMKPLDGTFAENAEKWGVAGINVDGGRIACSNEDPNLRPNKATHKLSRAADPYASDRTWNPSVTKLDRSAGETMHLKGRWPANLLLDEEAAAMLDGQSGELKSGAMRAEYVRHTDGGNGVTFNKMPGVKGPLVEASSGGASRFFYVAKASRSERNEGCEGLPLGEAPGSKRSTPAEGRECALGSPRTNHHPTVKPLKLMEYLCTLTKTPTGGIVLDPFAGSGSTLIAAERTGRPWIGIEMNPEYVAIANARIAANQVQMKMAI